MLKAPSSTVNCSTRAGWRCSPITRAPTSAVSSPVTRLAGLSQGRSRITERSPVTGFSQTSPILWVCDPARRSGRGATFAPKSRIGDVWSATLPQSDKGRVARHLPAMSGRHDLPTSPKGTSFLRGVRAALATRGFNAPGQYVGRGGSTSLIMSPSALVRSVPYTVTSRGGPVEEDSDEHEGTSARRGIGAGEEQDASIGRCGKDTGVKLPANEETLEALSRGRSKGSAAPQRGKRFELRDG